MPSVCPDEGKRSSDRTASERGSNLQREAAFPATVVTHSDPRTSSVLPNALENRRVAVIRPERASTRVIL
jgi:hypothetical protein